MFSLQGEKQSLIGTINMHLSNFVLKSAYQNGTSILFPKCYDALLRAFKFTAVEAIYLIARM